MQSSSIKKNVQHFFQSFVQKERVAGLEITDAFIRLALLKENETTGAPEIVLLDEEPIPDGTIVEGTLRNSDVLTTALKKLIARQPILLHYYIVSLPTDNVYSHVFSFPQSVQGVKLERTMQLTIGFQLPIKPENYNLDWQKIIPDDQNEIFLIALAKKHVAAYVDALEKASIKPVAFEFQPISSLRVMDLPDEPTMVLFPNETSTTVAVFEQKVLRFCRVLPKSAITNKDQDAEIRKVSDYYGVERRPIAKVYKLSEVPLVSLFANQSKLKTNPEKWFAVLGAAQRGLVSRSKDSQISLLPVGTETAYQYQKALAFAQFTANFIMGISIFFVAAFIGVWIFVFLIQQKIRTQVNALSALPIPDGAVALENRAKDFNGRVAAMGTILKTFPRWSGLFEQLQQQVNSGVIVFNMIIPSPENTFSLTGVAKDRKRLNAFKKQLETSALFVEINLPLSNLEQKENIPFSLSLKLKDPSKLYDQ